MGRMLYDRLFQAPEGESFFLFGPRGTGKTTWLKEKFKDAIWIDLLSPREEMKYSMDPDLLKDLVLAAPERKQVVIDEVQKVPKILDVVHGLIEENRGVQFILTGSSSRKLKRAGVNLLAGRALWKNFHPFMGYELKDQFNLEQVLKTGAIPLIWNAPSPEAKLQAYVDLYLQEEVKAEALVRQVGEFSRFLHAISYSHASILNVTNISRECEVPRKTVELHLQILIDLLLGYTLTPFTARAQRQLTVHPKFYFFDPGVFRALRKQGFLDASTEAEGAALEGLVAEHLRSWIDFQPTKNELHFWRTRAGLEVDFVIYGSNAFYAIEVKNGRILSPDDFHGLKAFHTDYPEATRLLIYRGRERIERYGILCIPAEEFFTQLNPLSPQI
jgi:predicted AAA+ superfamily ATPase